MLPFRLLFLLIVLLLTLLNGVTSYGIIIDHTTCSNTNANIIQLALNDMVAMAQVAYDHTVGARDMITSLTDMTVVIRTFDTYFGLGAPNHLYRLQILICRYFWIAMFNIIQLTS